MFSIDTCTWFKIKLISKNLKVEIIDIFKQNKSRMFFTPDLIEELYHYFPELNDLIKGGVVLPREKVFKELLEYGFDEADSSLLEYGLLSNSIIVSEDPEMRTFSKLKKIRTISLAEFISLLNKWRKIDKKTKKLLIGFLRKIKNIGKKEFERLLK